MLYIGAFTNRNKELYACLLFFLHDSKARKYLKNIYIQRKKRSWQCPPPFWHWLPPIRLYNLSAESLSTVSTISSNYRPPLIDVNNNRRKLVNGEHNCPRQKAKHSRSHFTAGASRRRRLGCSQRAGERNFTADIHLPPESHFITHDHPLKRATDYESCPPPQTT